MSLTVRLLLVCLLLPVWAYAVPCADWPMWRDFEQRFIQADGRVMADESEQHYSTSEGQAYALFFSLVANDKNAFERILGWTRDNLAGGDLSARLPAWQWGKRADGTWGVADQNSASDADTWLAYTLLEAGRLWHEPRYTAQGNLLLANIRLHLVRNFSGLGMMLIPAVSGFDLAESGARFNPSYYPVQLFRVFAKTDSNARWDEIIENSFALIKAAAPHGYVPDWQGYVPGTGFMPDLKSGDAGTHDAIRVYLWWGMLDRHDPMAMRLKKVLYGMTQWIPRYEITPPLSVEARTGQVSGVSPPGFSAALLPYFATMDNKRALHLQSERMIAYQFDGLIGQDPRYYDQVLTLFGQGWLAHYFSFSSQGQLVVQWNSSCSAKK